LSERQLMDLPPFSHMALLRADALEAADALQFLEAARALLPVLPGIEVGPAMMAGMERRAGRARAQLLMQGKPRSRLHQCLTPWVLRLSGLREARRVRWSLDIDPYDTF